jgi:superfamily II DNA or RNA helicase
MSSILEPRWYQFSAAQAAIDAKRSIVRIATGGGKTPVACIITAQLNTPTLFLVHTKDLLRQAREAYSEFMNYDCGQIGDGVLDVRDITVGTIQTVARILGTHYKKDSYSEEDENDDTDINGKEQVLRRFIDSVGLLIQDEVHRVASDSAFEVASLVRNAEHYVGFSASPWRDDGADIMLEAAYGHQVFRMSASELIDMNYLMQPTINVRTVTGAPVHGTYDQIYKQWVVENEANNEIVVQDAVDLYNQHRISMILVKQIKHGQILSAMLKREGIPHEFLQGNDSSTVRGDAIREMRNRNLKCLIATTIADEGLDIKPLDSILLAGRGKSSVRALQRVGRTLRLYDKPLPIVREYHDKCRYLEDHFNCRLRMYQTEPRFIINRG